MLGDVAAWQRYHSLGTGTKHHREEYAMRLILFMIFGIINMFIAQKKGFNPWAWLLAAGLLGLILLACLPSAMAQGIDEATRHRRRKTDTSIGIAISVLGLLLAMVFTQKRRVRAEISLFHAAFISLLNFHCMVCSNWLQTKWFVKLLFN